MYFRLKDPECSSLLVNAIILYWQCHWWKCSSVGEEVVRLKQNSSGSNAHSASRITSVSASLKKIVRAIGSHLLTWINFESRGITSITNYGIKLCAHSWIQRSHRWRLWMDKEFHPALYQACAHLSMLELKPRSHLADLTADLSRPWWSGKVLWSRREVGKYRGWILEGPERSVNLFEVSPTVPDCFAMFKTIGSGRGWRTVVGKSLGRRVRSLIGR